MKAAQALLNALQAKWPAHPPRNHSLTLASDGRLMISLGLEVFHFAKLDLDDMTKPIDQLVEEMVPLLEKSRAEAKATRAAFRKRRGSK